MPAYGQLKQQAVWLAQAEKYLLYFQRFFSARHDKKWRVREKSREDGGRKETGVWTCFSYVTVHTG